MTGQRLLSFLETSQLVTKREWLRDRFIKEKREFSEDAYRVDQGVWYARRQAFEGSFLKGDAFLYGALNLGTAGPGYYSLYCVVLPPLVHEIAAMLPHNSAECYVAQEAPHELKQEELCAQVGAWEARGEIACLKHADNLPTEADRWPELVCGSDGQQFIEAIFPSPVALGGVEIQMRESIYDKIYMAAFDVAAKNALQGTPEYNEIASLLEVLEAAEKKQMTIKTLEGS